MMMTPLLTSSSWMNDACSLHLASSESSEPSYMWDQGSLFLVCLFSSITSEASETSSFLLIKNKLFLSLSVSASASVPPWAPPGPDSASLAHKQAKAKILFKSFNCSKLCHSMKSVKWRTNQIDYPLLPASTRLDSTQLDKKEIH